jgi:chromosome segregation ATPase
MDMVLIKCFRIAISLSLLKITFCPAFVMAAETDLISPSIPTYTRQDLVYDRVEDEMRSAEESKSKLVMQREELISQQLRLERQKSKIMEQGLDAGTAEIENIRNATQSLDQKIAVLNDKVNQINQQVSEQDQKIQQAAQYLKSQAQGSLADGEQWLKDFYQQRTQMYPSEAKRYQLELDSLLKQYRQEQKQKMKESSN